MKRTLWISLVAAVLVIAGVGTALYLNRDAAPEAKEPVRIHGFVTLSLGQFIWDKNPDRCQGWKGFDDIKAGTQVVITDAASKTIALGALASGLPRRDPSDDSRAISCSFEFSIEAPGGHDFYGVEVSHRGRLQYAPQRFSEPLVLTF